MRLRPVGASFESTARGILVANTASNCWRHSDAGGGESAPIGENYPIVALNARNHSGSN